MRASPKDDIDPTVAELIQHKIRRLRAAGAIKAAPGEERRPIGENAHPNAVYFSFSCNKEV